jgi:hypothetical protein
MPEELGDLLAAPAVQTIGLTAGVGLIAAWLAAAWWAYKNAVRRTGHGAAGFLAAGWIILSTPLLLPLALAVYALARPTANSSNQRITALAFELAAATQARPACPGCLDAVDPAWVRCPGCGIWLAVPCSVCAEWAPAGLEICPFCAADAWDRPAAEGSPAAVAALRRGRRSRHAGRGVRRRGVRPDLALDLAHLASPCTHGGRRVRRSGHRRLPGVAWAPASDLQPDLSHVIARAGGMPT